VNQVRRTEIFIASRKSIRPQLSFSPGFNRVEELGYQSHSVNRFNGFSSPDETVETVRETNENAPHHPVETG